jgi:hypothetical protein
MTIAILPVNTSYIPFISHSCPITPHTKPGQASAARRRRRMMQLGNAARGTWIDSQPQKDGHVALIGFVKNIGPKSSGLSSSLLKLPFGGISNFQTQGVFIFYIIYIETVFLPYF